MFWGGLSLAPYKKQYIYVYEENTHSGKWPGEKKPNYFFFLAVHSLSPDFKV